MRIGLLGGSFDPVHNGHLKLASAAHREQKLSRVYFVLSKNPFKKNQRQAPFAVRLKALRQALRGRSYFKVALWELKRRGPSYSVDTILDCKRRFPNDELFFIMGSDALKSLKRWKRPRVIVKNARLLVGRRPGSAKNLPKKIFGQEISYLKSAFPSVSSSAIRKGKRRGR